MAAVGFEYRPIPGVHQLWRLEGGDGAVIEDEVEGLGEVEDAIDNAVFEYSSGNCATVTLVRGGDGWREYTLSDGNVISYRWILLEHDFRCTDCEYDTWDENFKVSDELWAIAGGVAGRLCINCLEQRLDRPLTLEDFVDDDLNVQTSRPSSQRLRERRDPPRPPRRKVTYDAPVGSVDLRAFNEVGEAFEITACLECLPWRAEVVTDPETNEILVREWHAVECEAFQDLIHDDG
jgi:hypothetical protein